MSDDYLWDKSGEPDPEIQRLENLLSPLGHKGGDAPRFSAGPSRRASWILAIAACVLVAAGAALWYVAQRMRPAWQVAAVEGAPSVARLAKGQSLNTDAHSRARLNLNDVGEVEVEPNTRLSVLAIKPGEHRLALERGAIHALIWAPPGQFVVNTPSAQTVDLGCEYKLQVDADGTGLVQVSAGWVAFEDHGRESFIPAAAACVTRPGKGPGIPYYQDAPAALVEAVRAFDSSGSIEAAQAILASARPRDALTVWHLLRRLPASDRGPAYDRLARLITIPPGVARAGVLAGDPQMIDALWNALDLGDTTWWRMWKSRSPK